LSHLARKSSQSLGVVVTRPDTDVSSPRSTVITNSQRTYTVLTNTARYYAVNVQVTLTNVTQYKYFLEQRMSN